MTRENEINMSQDNQTKKKNGFTVEPWASVHRNGVWEIQTYSSTSDKFEVIATIAANNVFPEGALADFITRAINLVDKREALIDEMALVLGLCLKSEDGRLDWTAEHDGEVVLQRANSRIRI